MTIGNKAFDAHARAYVMGILNVTPDSFYDGGRFNALDAALFRTEQMIAEGADIVDVGGESTRPNFTAVSAQEEIARAVPVIEAIKARFDIPVSIDTYKGEVASAAVLAGADMINDVYGLQGDGKMASVIAQAGVACVITHNDRGKELGYTDKHVGARRALPESNVAAQGIGQGTPCPYGDVITGLKRSLNLAADAGIALDKIILDPGIGFGKTVEQNLSCIANLDRFRRVARECDPYGACRDNAQDVPYAYPLLIGASNKSFIGAVLNVRESERLYGTLATTAIAVLNGASFIRVHDVKANKQVIAMTEAIKNEKN